MEPSYADILTLNTSQLHPNLMRKGLVILDIVRSRTLLSAYTLYSHIWMSPSIELLIVNLAETKTCHFIRHARMFHEYILDIPKASLERSKRKTS